MRHETIRKNSPPSASALFCCLLWSSAIPCIKIGYRLFQISSGATADILLFAGTRFFFGGLLTLIAGSLFQRKPLFPAKKDWGGIFIVGLCQTFLQYIFFYLAVAYTTAARSAIINGTTAFFSLLIAALIFRQEKLTGRKALGCLVGFAGILVMNLGGAEVPGKLYLLGDLLMLCSGIVTSASNSLIKRFSAQMDPTLLNGWQFTWGGAALALVGLAFGGRLQFTSAGCCWILLWLALVSAMAYTLWSILLSYHPVSRIAIFMCTTPLFGIALTALLLGETQEVLRIQNMAALVLVSTGVYIVYREKNRSGEKGL